jgi:uncharacterized membrane protein SirB2
MIEYYPAVKMLHIGSVIASGSLFAARGLLVLAGRERLAMLPPLRWASYLIDTVLLGAAILLSTMLMQYPLVHGWLTAKVVLLLVYIGLGTMALRRARSRTARAAWYIAALATFGLIVLIARAHHPLGPFAALLG